MALDTTTPRRTLAAADLRWATVGGSGSKVHVTRKGSTGRPLCGKKSTAHFGSSYGYIEAESVSESGMCSRCMQYTIPVE